MENLENLDKPSLTTHHLFVDPLQLGHKLVAELYKSASTSSSLSSSSAMPLLSCFAFPSPPSSARVRLSGLLLSSTRARAPRQREHRIENRNIDDDLQS